jgi:hypothetical protein
LHPKRPSWDNLVTCTRVVPLPRRPHVASPEPVRITRDGDDAITEYADGRSATTHLALAATQLAAMTDADVLAFWNEQLAARQACREGYHHIATEIPAGKPQVEYFCAGRSVGRTGRRAPLPDHQRRRLGRRPKRQGR